MKRHYQDDKDKFDAEGCRVVWSSDANEPLYEETLRIPAGTTQIPEGAYADQLALTEVIVPEGVTVIGRNAFSGCSRLRRIALPEGLLRIEGGAFADCTCLREVALPASLKVIGGAAQALQVSEKPYREKFIEVCGGAFEGCTALEGIVLPAGLRSIGVRAFSGCRNLQEATLPEGLQELGGGAFCATALTEAHLPASLREIGGARQEESDNDYFRGMPEPRCPGCFQDCTALVRVTFPEGLEVIGAEAFSGCTALMEAHFPQSIAKIGGGAFRNCTALHTAVLPRKPVMIATGVPWLGYEETDCYGAFFGCASLVHVTLPDPGGLYPLGTCMADAFHGCPCLRDMQQPADNA